MTENTAPQINGLMESSVSYPYSLNPDPDPAKNLNSDLNPSYFLTLSKEKKIKSIHDYKIKKSIER